MKTKGTIIYFRPSHNHGRATDSQGNEVYIHANSIIDDAKILIKGDEVEFDVIEKKIDSDPQTRYQANNVSRIEQRFTGIVLSFLDGKGIIICNQDGNQYSIHYKQFISTIGEFICDKENTIIKLTEGDYVEFSIEGDGNSKKATKIYYDSRKPLLRFASIPNLDYKFAELAKLSPEPWNYLNSDPENKFLPVLKNYIYYTFARLRKEEVVFNTTRIALSSTKINWKEKGKPIKKTVKCACFNTGLADRRQEVIYAYFVENLTRRSVLEPEWILLKFCKASDSFMNVFREKPDGPDYFKEISEVSEIIYDPQLEHELDYEHILEDRNARFKHLSGLSDFLLQGILDQGLKRARERVRRNYKAAVPQYYNGKMQLLLPLSLTEPDKTDLALVVEKDGERYFSSTVLELEWAYSNARLIAKPDREWLDPVKEVEEKDLQDIEREEEETI